MMCFLSRHIVAFCISTYLLLASGISYGQEIRLKQEGNRIIEVMVISDEVKPSFSLRVKGSFVNVLGDWKTTKSAAIFTPLVPLSVNRTYGVFNSGKLLREFTANAKDVQAPAVIGFYPSSGIVPENWLKCYLHFSEPVQEKDIYEHVYLVDEQGLKRTDVFLPLKPALWNKDQTVLTLWIDPGRVKRGLERNKQLGKPLVAGEKYQLVVSSNLKGLDGNQLDRQFTAQLEVKDRDQKMPSSSDWQVSSPKAGTQELLQIELGESMDYLTTMEGISISFEGTLVKGTVSLSDHERIWQFFPATAWSKGDYVVKINPTVEDLAGNNFLRPFDLDLTKEEEIQATPQEIYFSIH